MTTRTPLRTPWGTLLAAVALACGLVLGTAGTGVAADEGTTSIAHAEPSADGLQILVSVPADAEVDLDGVSVTVDGQEASSTARKVGTAIPVRRTTVLAIDTSLSMKGDRFDAAKSAAEAFLAAVPDDVYVGIVTFAGDVTTYLPATQDRAQARQVLDSLRLSRGTRLYDGVIQAVREAGTDGQRTVLVLSDGADTSQTDLTDATTALSDNDVLADVVSLGKGGDAAALTSLAGAGNGQVISAEPAALKAAFDAEADILARQILVTAQVPDAVEKTDATLAVTLPSTSGDLSAQVYTVVRTSTPSPTPSLPSLSEEGWSPPGWTLYVGPLVLGLGLILVVALLIPRGAAPASAAERVTKYTDAQTRLTDDRTGPRMDTDQALATAKETAQSVLRHNQDLDARISARLEKAGSELKSAEWLLLHGAIFFVSGLLGVFISGGNIVVGILFLLFGFVGPWMYLGFKGARRKKAFNRGLPDTLQLMSGSLAAGLSLAQSVDTIVREGPDPIAGEFRRVLVETRLGVTLEDAMEGLAVRFESKDFEWVVMAIKIQRQVGGNLAELLDTVAATMREREYLRRQVAALAAEGKLSAWVLGLLPPLFLLYLLLANRDYVMPLFTEPVGWLMLAGAGTILSVGVFWMSKLVKVEV